MTSVYLDNPVRVSQQKTHNHPGIKAHSAAEILGRRYTTCRLCRYLLFNDTELEGEAVLKGGRKRRFTHTDMRVRLVRRYFLPCISSRQ